VNKISYVPRLSKFTPLGRNHSYHICWCRRIDIIHDGFVGYELERTTTVTWVRHVATRRRGRCGSVWCACVLPS